MSRSTSIPAWVVFGVVLLAEYLSVSYAVDAQDLLRPAGLQPLLGQIGDVAPLAFVSLAAVFLTGGHAVRLRLRALSAYRAEQLSTVLWGMAHVAAFGGVLALGWFIKSLDVSSIALARGALAVWFLGVGVSGISLVLALWSPKMVLDALGGLRRELTIGLGVGVVAWTAGMLARLLWKPLAWLTLELVHALLTLFMPDPVASTEEALVGTSRFYVEVAPECSGVEGVGLMLTFVLAYLYVQRAELRWPRSWLLVPVSAVFVWLLNVVRVTALIAVGTWWSPEVALGGFHSKAGWVFFVMSALLTVYFVQRSPTFCKSAVVPPAVSPNPVVLPEAAPTSRPRTPAAVATAAYLTPLLVLLAVKLVTGLFTSGFDYLYPLGVVATAAALWKFRRHYLPIELGSLGWPLGVGVLVAVVWIVGFVEGPAPSQLGQQLSALPAPWGALWLVVRIMGTTLTVPIVEELAFRGYLLRRFMSPEFHEVPYRHFSWLGLLASSVAFGVLHSQWGLGIFAGAAFGLLTVARGRLADAVVAHAVANAVIVVYVLGTRDWALLG